MAQLKLQLLEEEAEEQVKGDPLFKVSPGAFFRKAIEIEEHQYVYLFPLNLFPTLMNSPDENWP